MLAHANYLFQIGYLGKCIATAALALGYVHRIISMPNLIFFVGVMLWVQRNAHAYVNFKAFTSNLKRLGEHFNDFFSHRNRLQFTA